MTHFDYPKRNYKISVSQAFQQNEKSLRPSSPDMFENSDDFSIKLDVVAVKTSREGIFWELGFC